MLKLLSPCICLFLSACATHFPHVHVDVDIDPEDNHPHTTVDVQDSAAPAADLHSGKTPRGLFSPPKSKPQVETAVNGVIQK